MRRKVSRRSEGLAIIKRRRDQIVELSRLGARTNESLAEELHVDPATISRDRTALRKAWITRREENSDALFGELSDTLRYVAEEALRMWAVSCLPKRERIRYRDTANGLTIKEGVIAGHATHAEVRVYDGIGNPALGASLEGVRSTGQAPRAVSSAAGNGCQGQYFECA